MARRSVFILSLLVAGAFAGCIQGESTDGNAGGNQENVAAGPAEFDETSGGIEGIVTDVELQPIAGAIVGILASDLIAEPISSVTDPTGSFSMSRVPPGEHNLQVSALGFGAGTKRVNVEAGAVASVSIALEALAVKAPYGVTEILKGSMSAVMWRLTPECMYFSSSVPPSTPSRNMLKTCGGLRTDCAPQGDYCERHYVDEFLPENDWKTIVAELAWEAQSGVTGKGFQLDLNAPNITRSTSGSIDQADPHTFDALQGRSPIVIRVDNPETLIERAIPESDWYSYPDGEGCTAPDEDGAGNCDWFFRIFGGYCDLSSLLGACDAAPVDYGLPQDNAFTLYFSYFFMEPAAAGFSALPDA